MKPRTLLSLGAVALLICSSCAESQAEEPGGSAAGKPLVAGSEAHQGSVSEPVSSSALADAALADYRRELLDVAFEAATLMPVRTQIKDRSRAQERVVSGLLELGQHKTAHDCIVRIENWRRGLSLAHLAVACVEAGSTVEDVAPFLAGAERVAAGGEEVLRQAWRRDRILARIGTAYAKAGQHERALELEDDIGEDSESGRVAAAQAERADEEACDRFLASFDKALHSGSMDVLSHAVDAALVYYDRYFDDEVRAGLIEAKLQSAVGRMPRELSVDSLLRMAEITAGHGKQERALLAVREAREIMGAARWRPDDEIRLLSTFSETLHRIGRDDLALRDADLSLEIFKAHGSEIQDFWRADPLRCLAEALVELGDKDRARDVYRRALEEGGRNPNARPRANDLVGTCVSMAVHDVEPDAAMWETVTSLQGGLADPW